jgi:hypothetical protein
MSLGDFIILKKSKLGLSMSQLALKWFCSTDLLRISGGDKWIKAHMSCAIQK